MSRSVPELYGLAFGKAMAIVRENFAFSLVSEKVR